jgi:hypothetical protein
VGRPRNRRSSDHPPWRRSGPSAPGPVSDGTPGTGTAYVGSSHRCRCRLTTVQPSSPCGMLADFETGRAVNQVTQASLRRSTAGAPPTDRRRGRARTSALGASRQRRPVRCSPSPHGGWDVPGSRPGLGRLHEPMLRTDPATSGPSPRWMRTSSAGGATRS